MGRLRHVNQAAISNLVPPWACNRGVLAETLDGMFGNLAPDFPEWHSLWDHRLPFWIEADFRQDLGSIRIVLPDDRPINHGGLFLIDCTSPEGVDVRIEFPLNPIFFYDRYRKEETHTLYLHQFSHGDAPKYFGVTQRAWWARLAEHKASALRGSRLMFHRAISETGQNLVLHKVAISFASYDAVMQAEEEFVNDFSLYPKGLNMIPGGFAGIKYLSSMGFSARTPVERDVALERLLRMDTVKGRANPLCASRWAVDQEYINAVICGHGTRLAVDQVRLIRILSDSGYDAAKIAEITGASEKQAVNVIGGKRYSRVA